MYKILQQIQEFGIVPVVVLDDSKDAYQLANSLCSGGLPCAEVTFRTDAAEDSIKIISKAFPNMLVGAGTVLTVNQVDKAVKAGAKFIVSPGLNPKIVKYCINNNIPIIPGISSPSDIELAIELGLNVVKFFPSEALGGLSTIKAISGPYTNMKFMPTGGINSSNLNSYLAFDKIIACGGSWMVKKDLIKSGDFNKITQLTKDAVLTMLGFKLKHIGINCMDENQANQTASTFEKLFGMDKKAGNSSIFAGSDIEAMKSPFLGKNGHIGIGTNDISRAISYLKKQGIEFDMDTAKYQDEKIKMVYLKNEISGFAIHLLEN